jgi:hypothetical protein
LRHLNALARRGVQAALDVRALSCRHVTAIFAPVDEARMAGILPGHDGWSATDPPPQFSTHGLF